MVPEAGIKEGNMDVTSTIESMAKQQIRKDDNKMLNQLIEAQFDYCKIRCFDSYSVGLYNGLEIAKASINGTTPALMNGKGKIYYGSKEELQEEERLQE